MEFKIVPIDVPKDDPFRYDALGRKEHVGILNDFVKVLSGPFTIALNGAWGTGKTVFVRMWSQSLSNHGYKCLYFNAWQNDFADDPLVAFIEEMASLMEEEGENRTAIEHYYGVVKEHGLRLLKGLLPAAIKAATAGAVDLTDLPDMLPGLAEKIADQELKAYENKKKTMQAFRTSLTEYAAKVTEKTEQGRILFFVDELDRCRPTYAIQLLERIKHLFDVEKLIFVLSMDREQLAHSVKGVYGADMDATGYLQRFIDLEYALPEPSPKAYTNCLFKQFGFEQYFKERIKYGGAGEDELFLDLFTACAQAFRLSLRAQERVFTLSSIALSTTPANHYLHPALLVVLMILRQANPDLYNNFKANTATAEDVLHYLFTEKSLRADSWIKDHIEGYLLASTSDTDWGKKRIKELRAIHENRESSAWDSADHLLGLITDGRPRGGALLSYITKKIEMTSQFGAIT